MKERKVQFYGDFLIKTVLLFLGLDRKGVKRVQNENTEQAKKVLKLD